MGFLQEQKEHSLAKSILESTVLFIVRWNTAVGSSKEHTCRHLPDLPLCSLVLTNNSTTSNYPQYKYCDKTAIMPFFANLYFTLLAVMYNTEWSEKQTNILSTTAKTGHLKSFVGEELKHLVFQKSYQSSHQICVGLPQTYFSIVFAELQREDMVSVPRTSQGLNWALSTSINSHHSM